MNAFTVQFLKVSFLLDVDSRFFFIELIMRLINSILSKYAVDK